MKLENMLEAAKKIETVDDVLRFTYETLAIVALGIEQKHRRNFIKRRNDLKRAATIVSEFRSDLAFAPTILFGNSAKQKTAQEKSNAK